MQFSFAADILISAVSGVLTLIGVCVTAWSGQRKAVSEVTAKLDLTQALTDVRLNELTREVREHNNFARRMPVVEEQIKVLNHRIQDLEQEE